MPASEIKERPILMSAPMIRALLSGAKTQTRRIMKVPHKNNEGRIVLETPIEGSDHAHYRSEGNFWELWGPLDPDGRGLLYEWGFSCPYGKVGERLWVRETCYPSDDKQTVAYRADGDMPKEARDIGCKWTP